jgi:bifunctional non-homologous end joining protein LigD
MLPHYSPMRLLRVPEPIDHPDFVYEVKHDGFRSLAYVKEGRCQLVSRNGHVFKSWPHLASEIAAVARCSSAVLDGEICCLDPDGRTNFYRLMFRRQLPFFYAFDVLAIDGKDLTMLPLIERKVRLHAIMPPVQSRLLYVDAIPARGIDLYRLACDRDLEGIVGKWSRGTYQCDGRGTSWLKIKNAQYSQMDGRRELFEARRDRQQRIRTIAAPELRLA